MDETQFAILMETLNRIDRATGSIAESLAKLANPMVVVDQGGCVASLLREQVVSMRVDTLLGTPPNVASRTSAVLQLAGIRTVGDLLRHSEVDLLRVEGFGMKAMRAIREGLMRHGLSLEGERGPP